VFGAQSTSSFSFDLYCYSGMKVYWAFDEKKGSTELCKQHCLFDHVVVIVWHSSRIRQFQYVLQLPMLILKHLLHVYCSTEIRNIFTRLPSLGCKPNPSSVVCSTTQCCQVELCVSPRCRPTLPFLALFAHLNLCHRWQSQTDAPALETLPPPKSPPPLCRQDFFHYHFV
jgi:hypothetical protein